MQLQRHGFLSQGTVRQQTLRGETMRIICTAPAIGLASVSFAHAGHWRRFDFRRSNLRQMGRCLEQRDQHQAELPYDWLGRRHQSGQQPHGGFRRIRYARRGGPARSAKTDAVPHRNRRRRKSDSRPSDVMFKKPSSCRAREGNLRLTSTTEGCGGMAIMRRTLQWMIATSLTVACPALAQSPLVTPQPAPGAPVAPYFVNPASDPPVSRDELLHLLPQKVKYVFVI